MTTTKRVKRMPSRTSHERMLLRQRAVEILRNSAYGSIITMAEAMNRAAIELHLG